MPSDGGRLSPSSRLAVTESVESIRVVVGVRHRVSELHPALPSISVVVPTYKRPALLGRAVRSILDQSLQDFELIVVDDASGDDTEQTVAAFSDPRVRYVRHEENRGLAAARNSGIKAALAPLIAFLDDDDDYLPSYLEAMSGRLGAASEDVAFVACGVREVYERPGEQGSRDVIPPRYSYESHRDAYRDFLRRVPFSGWFITARKSALDAVGGFDEAIRIEMDRDLLHRLVREYRYDVEPTILAHHYFHDQAHLNFYGPHVAAAYRHLTAKNEEELSKDRVLFSNWYYKLGWLHYHAGEPALGRRYLWTALRRSPLHMKAWWALVSYEALGSRAPAMHAALSRSARRAHLARRSATEA
jgi:glycosyltransferase involved in cell wall biosynthesis